MIFLPVVAREMSVLARRRSTYGARTVTAIFALVLMGWVLLVSMSGITFAQIGKSIFLVLSGLSFACALFAGAYATSDVLSEEKREGTLGLLFLTDLKGYDIVLGKLAASSFNWFYALLGIVPMLSLAILLGGVTLAQIGQVALVLANTMFLSLALGVFISALSINERRAMFASLVLLFLLTIGPFFASAAYTGFQSLPAEFLWISPLYPYIGTQTTLVAVPGFDSSLFYPSLAFQHALGWACLVLGSLRLPSAVNDLPGKRLSALRNKARDFTLGNTETRKRHRAELLDKNAFLWLAGREKNKSRWAWVVLAAFVGLYLWVGYNTGRMRLDLEASCTILFLAHFVLKLWLTSEVCSRLIQDRRSGALELLLSTPLSIKQIARGQHLALRRLFAGPVLALLAVEGWLLYVETGWNVQSLRTNAAMFYLAGMTTLVLDFWALTWVGLWLSLFGKSMERVLIATVARVMAVPWLVFLAITGLLAGMLVMNSRAKPEPRELVLIWWACSVFFALLFAIPARQKFFRHFREIAANRYENPAALTDAAALEKRAAAAARGARTIPLWMRRHPAWSSVIAVLLLLLAGAWARKTYWEFQLKRWVAEIAARQEPVRLTQLSRIRALAPARDDGFAFLAQAGPVNQAGLQPHVLHVTFTSQSGNRWAGADGQQSEQLERVVRANSVQFGAFLKITNFTSGNLPLVVDMQSYLPLQTLHNYANLGFADLMLGLLAEDGARVDRDLRVLLHMSWLLYQQPQPNSQSLCVALLGRIGRALEGAFQMDLLSDRTLLELEQTLGKMKSPDLLHNSLLVARATLLDRTTQTRLAMMWPRNPAAMLRIGLAEATGTTSLQMIRVLVTFEKALAAAPSNIESFALASALSPIIRTGPQLGPSLEEMGNYFVRHLILLNLSANAHINLLENALELERLRRNSTEPAVLAKRIADRLAARSRDPYSGQPLIFRQEAHKSVLYSVGPNGQDDGGALLGPTETGDISFYFYESTREENQP